MVKNIKESNFKKILRKYFPLPVLSSVQTFLGFFSAQGRYNFFYLTVDLFLIRFASFRSLAFDQLYMFLFKILLDCIPEKEAILDASKLERIE